MPPDKFIIGLMSGTSLDGIDAVLLRVRGSGTGTRFSQLAYAEYPFPRGLKQMLLNNSVPETSRVDDITRLNMLLAVLYARAARAIARKAAMPLSRVSLIGSHGQTIHHLPRPRRMFGVSIAATLQIGDPSALATLTGVPTVGNFRIADMAAGGQGAPLVPYFDWMVFRSPRLSRVLLNIGGIANITVLPAGCEPEDVVAFDTGPGNMVVDALMQRFFGVPFDRNGRTAAGGMVSTGLLAKMMRHPFLRMLPPKSTGREAFGEAYLRGLLARAEGYDRNDIVATASAFTARSVHDAWGRFTRSHRRPDQLIVSGGGARNRFFLGELKRLFEGTAVIPASELGVSPDAKEAICFAILANETVSGNAGNIPCVTGAARRVTLGSLSVP